MIEEDRNVPWDAFNIRKFYCTCAISSGYARLRDEKIECFLFSSTFYIDINNFLQQLPEIGHKFTVAFDLDRQNGGELHIQMQIMTPDHGLASESPLFRLDGVQSMYRDCAQLAISLSYDGAAKMLDGGRLRLMTYIDAIEPTILTFSNVRLLGTPENVDTEMQLGDQRAVGEGRSYADALVDHRNNGWSALHFAAHWDHPEWVHSMLEDGISPDAQETNGATALHRAADMGNEVVARLLLEAGANPNSFDSNLGESPLDCAIRRAQTGVRDLILSYVGLPGKRLPPQAVQELLGSTKAENRK